MGELPSTSPAGSLLPALAAAFKRRFARGGFARHVGVISGGTVLAQGLSFLALMYLTHRELYTPTDFGMLAFYSSVVAVLGIVSCGRYEQAVPLPEEDRDGAHLLVLSLAILIGMSALLALVVWLFGDAILARVKDGDGLRPYRWLFPIGLLGAGTYQVFNYWAIRKKAFTQIGKTKLTQGIGQSVVWLGLGHLSVGPLGLLLGDFFGRAGGSAGLIASAWRAREAFRDLAAARMAALARAYRQFPLYSVWNSLLNASSMYMPGLLFPFFFQGEELGYYSIAFRVSAVPVSLLGLALTSVFYQRAAECVRTGGDLHRLIRQLYRSLLTLVLPPAVLLWIFAPPLFRLAFGSEFQASAEYFRFILPWLCLLFTVSASTSIFPILGLQHLQLRYEVLISLLRLSAILVGALIFQNALTAVGLFGAVGFLYCAFFLWYLPRLARRAHAVVPRSEAVATADGEL